MWRRRITYGDKSIKDFVEEIGVGLPCKKSGCTIKQQDYGKIGTIVDVENIYLTKESKDPNHQNNGGKTEGLDEAGSSSSAHLENEQIRNNRQQNSGMDMVNFCKENEKVHWLKIQMPKGKQSEQLRAISKQSVHAYTLENARLELIHFVKRGIVQVHWERVFVHPYISSRTATDKVTSKMEISVPSLGIKSMEFEVSDWREYLASNKCILKVLRELYNRDMIKEAAIEMHAKRRKNYLDPTRVLDRKLGAWLDSSSQTFCNILDTIAANPDNFDSESELAVPLDTKLLMVKLADLELVGMRNDDNGGGVTRRNGGATVLEAHIDGEEEGKRNGWRKEREDGGNGTAWNGGRKFAGLFSL